MTMTDYGLATASQTETVWLAPLLGPSTELTAAAGSQALSSPWKAEAFADYVPTEGDIFVSTYARSGTNWTMQIAHQIAHYGEGTFDHIHDVVPWPESPTPNIVPLSDWSVQERSPTGLRVIKTHLESHRVPYNESAKYVTVVRDPKDVFVSSYFFCGMAFTVDEWLDFFLSGRFRLGSWPEHTAGYWSWLAHPNVLVLTFDEMVRDLPAVVRRISDLMQVKLTDAQLDRVVAKSSFQYMKAIDRRFSPPMVSVGGNGHETVIVRSGKIGEYIQLINREQQARIDKFCTSELRRLGSDFPYRELFAVT